MESNHKDDPVSYKNITSSCSEFHSNMVNYYPVIQPLKTFQHYGSLSTLICKY